MSDTAVDACERAIRRGILRGEHAPGERLPPERALAETLGVNRTTLRAALSRLACRGLLTVRQGSGYVVQDYRRVAGLELLPELAALATPAEHVAFVRDLLEVRRHLAVLVLERACERARPSDIAAIEVAVERFAELASTKAPRDDIAAADLDVLAALLTATGSPVLGLCLNPVSLVVDALPRLRDAIYVNPATNVAAYRALLGWLRSRTPDAIPAIAALLAERDARTLARLEAEGSRATPPPES